MTARSLTPRASSVSPVTTDKNRSSPACGVLLKETVLMAMTLAFRFLGQRVGITCQGRSVRPPLGRRWRRQSDACPVQEARIVFERDRKKGAQGVRADHRLMAEISTSHRTGLPDRAARSMRDLCQVTIAATAAEFDIMVTPFSF